MEIKKNSKGAQRFIAKRQLNSVYGKFATNPNITPKIPYIDDEDEIEKIIYISADTAESIAKDLLSSEIYTVFSVHYAIREFFYTE